MKNTDRIARKNVRITFQKNAVFVDKYQNHINMWNDYFTCFAYANTYVIHETGDEITTEERSITFKTRYCPELAVISSTGYRIIFDGYAYDILSIDIMNYQNREINFKCKKVRNKESAGGQYEA